MGSTRLSKRGAKLEKMTDRERRFIAEYLIDYNGTRAAIAAGYSKRSAQVTASKLLNKVHIKRAIGKAELKTQKQLALTKEEVLLHLAYLATRSASDFINPKTGRILDLHEMNERAQACVDGIEQTVTIHPETGEETIRTKLKLSPKAQGVEMALRHKGLFAPEKTEHTVKLNWDGLYNAPIPEDGNPGNVVDSEVISREVLGIEVEDEITVDNPIYSIDELIEEDEDD